MALRGAAARRYAQAIFDIATEQKALDKWLADINMLAAAFGTPNVISALEDPKIKEGDQKSIVSGGMPKEVNNPLAVNLIYLLVERNRLGLLPRIAESFQEMYNRAKGIVVAEVISATPLDEDRQKAVTEQLSRITGKTVQLRVRHDPRILGGLIARIGDELIDASVATRLATLAERMA